MQFLEWLQRLAADASAAPGFQARGAYVAVSILLPVLVGLFVGFSLRAIERIFGVELGRGGGH